MNLKLARDDEKGRAARRRNGPAKVCRRGDVRARIWADPTPWGDVEWRVSFVRQDPGRRGLHYSRSFDCDELADLIQAAFDARRWIARAEKRIRRYHRHGLLSRL